MRVFENCSKHEKRLGTCHNKHHPVAMRVRENIAKHEKTLGYFLRCICLPDENTKAKTRPKNRDDCEVLKPTRSRCS